MLIDTDTVSCAYQTDSCFSGAEQHRGIAYLEGSRYQQRNQIGRKYENYVTICVPINFSRVYAHGLRNVSSLPRSLDRWLSFRYVYLCRWNESETEAVGHSGISIALQQ